MNARAHVVPVFGCESCIKKIKRTQEIKPMEEMMKAITRAANAVASYYEKQAGVLTLPLSAQIDTTPGPVASVKTPKAPKAAKTATAEPQPSVPPAAAPAPAAPAATSEKESEERLKVVGEAFVQRFSKQDDAVGEVKGIIEKQFKVARLRELTHPQRVELIGILEARIREKDAALAQAPAPTGLEI